MAHTVIKPEKLAQTAVVALEESLVIPAVFRREGIDNYRGAKDDTINMVVEGVLPYRTYGWRNNRSTEIQFDEYTERKIAMSFGGDVYSAVRLTDEQNEMDFGGWAKLAAKQTEALGKGLEHEAVASLNNAPYEVKVTLGTTGAGELRKSLIGLRNVMNKLNVPGARSIIIGSDIEAALLQDTDLNLAQNVGEAEAVSALREATLGRRYGFNFVVAQELAADEGTAMGESAFVFLNAAPSVPQSVPFGATASYNGISLRWLRDYETTKFQDRSVFNTWKGFHYVDDPLTYWDDAAAYGLGRKTSAANHFVRAVKVELGSKFAVDITNTELSTITGVVDITPA